MSRTIWKYPLAVTGRQVLDMPVGAQPLTVQAQNGEGFLWAVVEGGIQRTEPRIIHTFGTGHLMPDAPNFRYLGTYQQADGSLVWHVFEECAP